MLVLNYSPAEKSIQNAADTVGSFAGIIPLDFCDIPSVLLYI